MKYFVFFVFTIIGVGLAQAKDGEYEKVKPYIPPTQDQSVFIDENNLGKNKRLYDKTSFQRCLKTGADPYKSEPKEIAFFLRTIGFATAKDNKNLSDKNLAISYLYVFLHKCASGVYWNTDSGIKCPGYYCQILLPYVESMNLLDAFFFHISVSHSVLFGKNMDETVKLSSSDITKLNNQKIDVSDLFFTIQNYLNNNDQIFSPTGVGLGGSLITVGQGGNVLMWPAVNVEGDGNFASIPTKRIFRVNSAVAYIVGFTEIVKGFVKPEEIISPTVSAGSNAAEVCFAGQASLKTCRYHGQVLGLAALQK